MKKCGNCFWKGHNKTTDKYYCKLVDDITYEEVEIDLEGVCSAWKTNKIPACEMCTMREVEFEITRVFYDDCDANGTAGRIVKFGLCEKCLELDAWNVYHRMKDKGRV